MIRVALVMVCVSWLSGCGPDDAGTCTGAISADPRPQVDLVINEVMAKAPDDTPDWIELYNAGSASIDAGCWSVVDKSSKHAPYVIPPGNVVAPGGYLVVRRDPEGKVGFTWGFGDSDIALLRDSEGRLADETTWEVGQAPAGASWGRLPDGSGAFQTLPAATLQGPNAAPSGGE